MIYKDPNLIKKKTFNYSYIPIFNAMQLVSKIAK